MHEDGDERAGAPDASPDGGSAPLPLPLDRIAPEWLGGFFELALEPNALFSMCRKLKLSTRGYRLEKLSTPEQADLLADEYLREPRAREDIERAVAEALHDPALRTTWLNPVSAAEIAQIVGGDPIVGTARLAWRYAADGDPAVQAVAERAIDTGLAILDDLDDAAAAELDKEAERSREPAAQPQSDSTDASREADWLALRDELDKRVGRAERERETARTQLQQARAEIADRDRRLNDLKGELSQLRLENAQARSDLSKLSASRTSEERRGAQDLRRLASERAHFEKQISALQEELDTERRRARELEAQAQDRSRPAQAAPVADEPDAPATEFTIPNFTREFYDSLARWDRRVVKTAFEKALHLARDHRHPSLRALQLEGIDNYFRIRIASDVRLIYRRAADGRLDILSLIDREDLDRYIRQAKTRRESF